MDNSQYTGTIPVAISRNDAKQMVLNRFQPHCGGRYLSQVKSQLSSASLRYYPYAIYSGDAGIRLNGSLIETKVDVAHGSDEMRTRQTYEYDINMEGSGHLNNIAVPLFSDEAAPYICQVDSVNPLLAQTSGPDANAQIAPASVNDAQAMEKAQLLAREALAQQLLSKYTGKYTGSISTINCQMQQTARILVPIYTINVKLFGQMHTLMINASTGQLYDTEPEVDQPGIHQGYLFQSPHFRKALKYAAVAVAAIDIIWLIYYLAS